MNLEFELTESLQKNMSLPVLIDLIYQYKQIGGTQQEAYATLEKIRENDIEESTENRILEVMDFVSGFCSPDKRIWNEVLINR
ncbi:MAG: hypothetical protein ETSY1_13365 [Candidatus Entotheonella factor]|uniref:Uncharacterized protein n=1 Tax=Entotheonella factor TaxID=1429438 RepID=W4LPI5_ENTF1|nr:hypothetical protein [Candidatus Entotheonella palauensis]ETW99862.1 MAG: hypothetical protein ETSY1_13365 [Candidatus Entotheonella factor]